MRIETLTCPTIVFCVEPTGAAIGESLSRAARGQHSKFPLFLWTVRVGEDAHTITPIRVCGSDVADAEHSFTNLTINDIVAAVIADVLSLRNWCVPPMMERPVSLRLSLVGAAWEITPSLLSSFTVAFHSSAQRHLGARYTTEACFLLPDLMSQSPPGAAEKVQDLLRAIKDCPDSQDLQFRADSVSYCWWFGRINTSGLTLDSFPSGIDDIATVIHGLLTTAPEYLPRSPGIITGRTQHMGVGYGELFVPREELFECLRARYACHLIRRLFLDKSDCVDHKRARRHAWAFTLSSACKRALREIELTPGGERIWKGFHPEIPDEVLEGETDEFLSNMRDSLDQFCNIDLPGLRGSLELSGRARRETLLAELEIEAQNIVQRTNGGLFEAQVFLAEIEAFLLETVNASAGEKPMNLQEMRRGFDLAFADILHLERPPFPNEHESKVCDLQQQLWQLSRLRNISAPPALESSIYEALRWNEGTEAYASLDQRIAQTSQQLREEVILWAQEVANAERELQRACHQIELEECRRAQEIEKREETLRQTANECKELLFELGQTRKTPGLLWFGRFGQRRALKEKNERLGQLQGGTLPQQARRVVEAYAERMQLSIEHAIYEIRDSVIQDALDHVRELHQRIVEAIGTLDSIRKSLGSVQAPTSDSVFRRSLVTDADLEILMERLTNTAAGLNFPECPSAWDICSQPATKTADQIREASGKPFTVVLAWTIADFVQLIGPQSTKVEALIEWLKHVSQPLSQATGGDTVNYSIIRTVDDLTLGRMLRHAFPEAVWIDDPKTPASVVLQLRHIPRVNGAILGLRIRSAETSL